MLTALRKKTPIKNRLVKNNASAAKNSSMETKNGFRVMVNMPLVTSFGELLLFIPNRKDDPKCRKVTCKSRRDKRHTINPAI